MTRPDLARLYEASPYAATQLERHPDWLTDLTPESSPDEDYRDTYAAEHPHAATEDELMQQLRRYKHHRQVRHIHAVVNGLIDEPAFLARTSALAETLISAALAWQHQALAARYGEPVDADGNPVPMLVLGMGKLGGGELNFSSDIDLIYAYRANGTTSGGRKPEEHETWYRKLAQRLIYTLDAVTEDGNVYRVDMRLRPFGQTGPLALTYTAMEQYYLIHGRLYPAPADILDTYRVPRDLRLSLLSLLFSLDIPIRHLSDDTAHFCLCLTPTNHPPDTRRRCDLKRHLNVYLEA